MPKTQPYINKRKWLEKRQELIAEQYRAGQNWHTIVAYLISIEHMPFELTEADFFKYCDFLLDEVGNNHKTQNIELQQQVLVLNKQLETLENNNKALGRENEIINQDKLKLIAQFNTLEQQNNELVKSEKQLKIIVTQYKQLKIEYEQLIGENTTLTQENQQQKAQLDNVAERIRLHNEQVYSQAEKHYKSEMGKLLLNIFFLKIIIAVLVILAIFLIGFIFYK